MVGIVERSAILGPTRVRVGDLAIGLPSSGLHTNGYSLVRKVFGLDDDPTDARRRLAEWVPELESTLGDELLVVHRPYLAELAEKLDRIHALAHLTGGGLLDNLPRALPVDLAVEIAPGSWVEPPIFPLIRRLGSLSEAEMNRTFNRGLGMVVFAAATDAQGLLSDLPEAWIVGQVVARGDGVAVRFR
jgi:phosphoribosylformylglycinamidine cyclo-ligase